MFFGSPFGRHSVVNPITNNDSWHKHMVSTPSNTEVCSCKQSTQTAQAMAACAKNIKLFWFHASSLHKRANNTLHCQSVCANTLFAQIACTCRGRFTSSWHRVVVPAVVICSTIDHAMSSKGTAEERQFLMEFIEYRSLPALWSVTSTEYRNKKNEQNAKFLNKYKEKYLNVEKKYVI